MKAAGFWREAAYALLISAAAAIAFEFCRPLLGSALTLRLTLLGAATVYLAILLAQSPRRSGRLLAACSWLVLCAALLVFNPSLSAWLLLPTVCIWLLRSLLSYRSPIPALVDASLGAFALAAAVVSAGHSQSLFLSLWCYFLVQALHVFVPGTATPRQDQITDPFDAAARHAEAALRRLSVRH